MASNDERDIDTTPSTFGESQGSISYGNILVLSAHTRYDVSRSCINILQDVQDGVVTYAPLSGLKTLRLFATTASVSRSSLQASEHAMRDPAPHGQNTA